MANRKNMDHAIHPILRERYSPYAFDNKIIPQNDLCSLFEAARWTASSFNEQPWHFIVASRDDQQDFQRILSCLMPANAQWACEGSTIALGITRKIFSANGKMNRSAEHDLGQATANIVNEAMSRGIYAHQMAGILPDHAQELYAIPQEYMVVCAMVLGYLGDPMRLPPALRERERYPQERHSLHDFVFSDKWGATAPFVIDRSL